MANDEESFFNIVGTEISRSLLVQQMINYYFEKLELGETQVTDFNEGSEIRNLLESIAVDLYDLMEDNYEVSKIAFIPTAYGEWLDAHGANPLINLPRNQGSEAVGMVTFSIPEAVTSDTIIGDGTVIVSEENNLEYITEGDCIIPGGTTSNDVFVSCLTVGEDGNSDANTLTIINDDNIDNSVSVTNNEKIIGGADEEDDESYRQRLLDFVRKDDFGSIGYYENLANSIDGVHDVLLVNTQTNLITVIVNGNDKPITDTILANVLTEFTDTNNIVFGHNFTVQAVKYTTIGQMWGGTSEANNYFEGCDFEITINTEQEISETEIRDFIEIIFNGGTSTNNYSFEGLNINESLSYDTLVSAFLNNYSEITNVSFTYFGESFTELTPQENRALEIYKELIIINQTVEE